MSSERIRTPHATPGSSPKRGAVKTPKRSRATTNGHSHSGSNVSSIDDEPPQYTFVLDDPSSHHGGGNDNSNARRRHDGDSYPSGDSSGNNSTRDSSDYSPSHQGLKHNSNGNNNHHYTDSHTHNFDENNSLVHQRHGSNGESDGDTGNRRGSVGISNSSNNSGPSSSPTLSPSSSDDNTVLTSGIIKSGLLDKRGGSLHFSLKNSFQTRFFMLHHTHFAYYKSQKAYGENPDKPLNTIPVDFMLGYIDGGVDEKKSDGDQVKSVTSSLKWKIVSSSRTIEVMSPSVEDKMEWWDAIRLVQSECADRKREMSVSPGVPVRSATSVIEQIQARKGARTVSSDHSGAGKQFGQYRHTNTLPVPTHLEVTSKEKKRISKRLAETRRFQTLFSLPPTEVLITSFSCAVLKTIMLHGRMYISENYVCFFSKIFHAVRVIAPLSEITGSTKANQGLFFDNALKIFINSDPYSWYFGSFAPKSRNKAYELINALIHDTYSSSVFDIGVSTCGDSVLVSGDGGDDVSDDESAVDDADEMVTITEEDAAEDHRAVQALAAGFRGDGGYRHDGPGGSMDVQRNKNAAFQSASASSSPRSRRAQTLDFGPRRAQMDQVSTPGASRENLKTLVEQTFPLSPAAFWNLFFTDDAEWPMLAFHEHRGDTEYQASLWTHVQTLFNEPNDNDETTTKTQENQIVRDMSLRVDLPGNVIGPSSTRIMKVQRCRIDDMEIETISITPDVPFGDAFHVVELWTMTEVPSPDDKTEKHCHVTMRVGVEIDIPSWKLSAIKGTLISRTHKDFTDTLKQWCTLALQFIDTHPNEVQAAKLIGASTGFQLSSTIKAKMDGTSAGSANIAGSSPTARRRSSLLSKKSDPSLNPKLPLRHGGDEPVASTNSSRSTSTASSTSQRQSPRTATISPRLSPASSPSSSQHKSLNNDTRNSGSSNSSRDSDHNQLSHHNQSSPYDDSSDDDMPSSSLSPTASHSSMSRRRASSGDIVISLPTSLAVMSKTEIAIVCTSVVCIYLACVYRDISAAQLSSALQAIQTFALCIVAMFVYRASAAVGEMREQLTALKDAMTDVQQQRKQEIAIANAQASMAISKRHSNGSNCGGSHRCSHCNAPDNGHNGNGNRGNGHNSSSSSSSSHSKKSSKSPLIRARSSVLESKLKLHNRQQHGELSNKARNLQYPHLHL